LAIISKNLAPELKIPLLLAMISHRVAQRW